LIDAAHIGRSFGPYTYQVTREQIQRLAAALGEQNPIYHDPAAAQAAGWADLPAPPTLATCYGLWANEPLLAELAALGAPLPRLLHGEQRYAYHAPVVAGDTLTARPTIIDITLKTGRSGPFALITLETSLHNQRGELVIVDRLVIVRQADLKAEG
jgi:acyl dehydratase